jgi:hypothetical protein
MTRLHIQVNQTLQFYRGQQGGSAPQRLFLSGGASVMPYTAQFFAEKINVPVEYFNPFRNVQIDPSVNLEDLARVAHSLGEVVGLGLRNLAHCPVELNLIPQSTRRWQSFNEKKPYLVATVFSLVAVVAAIGFLFQKLADVKDQESSRNVNPVLEPLRAKERQFVQANNRLKAAQQELDQTLTWLENRYYWGDVLTELRRAMLQAERVTQQKLRTDAGVWIEHFWTTSPGIQSDQGMDPAAAEMMRQQMMMQGGDPMADGSMPEGQPGGEAAFTLATPNATELNTIKLECRAVDNGDRSIVYAFEDELRASAYVERFQTLPEVMQDSTTSTYSFHVLVTLKRPLKL